MSRPLPTRALLAAALMVSAAAAAAAQSDRAARFMENCQRNRSDNEQFCETRDFTLAAGKSLTVDGRENGGITVHGWDRAETKVVAMIQAQALSVSDAASIAKQISIATNGADVRATGPSMNGRRESWSVSYEIWAPRQTDLSLSASNGGLSVDGIASRMDLETVNGGLSLADVAGDVRGTTVNGGITADLSGDRWVGSGLDLKTSNGGVHLTLPSNYSAQLETGTVNGGMDIGFPITVQGTLGRRFSTQLGNGGAMIRATTTNGGVSIRRR
ncbi:MAG: hypothetical protein JWM41_4169 [Gemmatimonadetes bacterium]|nr:hypothetical protein [Gemmatimonadota bacterium]